ncbi:alpha/beta fold hydrolase [Roseococcus sp. DSY-14]|uniref:alpha/beta fold hydrolase n=1 Tax=Roseococcus sp. DSY-14 TaxID=3369650 RepID=UPI00387AB624
MTRAALALAALLLAGGAAPLRVEGSGPVVVLESGQGGGDPAQWDAVARRLRPCMTVVRHDRVAAYGDAPAVHAAEVSARLRAALDAEGFGAPVILVAHSLGGIYALDFAGRFPTRVRGLVLVDATSPLEPPGAFAPAAPFPPGSAEAQEEEGLGPSIAGLPALPDIPLWVLAATRHGADAATEARWQQVQRDTAALAPRGRFRAVEGGHALHQEAPDAVAGAVLDIAGLSCPG